MLCKDEPDPPLRTFSVTDDDDDEEDQGYYEVVIIIFLVPVDHDLRFPCLVLFILKMYSVRLGKRQREGMRK